MQQTLRFALFGNTYQEHKSAHVTHLLEILRRKEAQICISNEFYDFLYNHTKADLNGLEVFEGNNFTADAAFLRPQASQQPYGPVLLQNVRSDGNGCVPADTTDGPASPPGFPASQLPPDNQYRAENPT